MSDIEEQESFESSDSSYPDDRRHEVRRVSKDRRDQVRYELDKGDRRSLAVLERRKVMDAGTEYLDKDDLEEQQDHELEEETVLDSVVGKISKLLGR